MIKKIVLFGGIVLASLIFIYCTTDESTIIGPFGNADKYLSVTSFSADKEKIYSNGDTSIVSLKVLDVDNSPAIGLKVDFTAQFGSITESDTTDSSGIAFATFISDDNTGANIITVDTGIKKYTLTIDVVNYHPEYVEMFSEFSTLVADGISTTIITVVFKDSVANPMPGRPVFFETTFGTLNSHFEKTDSTGTATTKLTSATEEGIATITVTSLFVEKEIDVEFKYYIPVPTLIEMTKDLESILADGFSETTIVAKVIDSDKNGLSGAIVDFSTSAGSLSKTTGVVANQEGRAIVTIRSSGSDEDIDAVITAEVQGSSLSETILVKFRGITMTTYVDSLQFSAGGYYNAFIRTELIETSEGTVIENTAVRFLTTIGEMRPPVRGVNEFGQAFSTLKVEVTGANQNDLVITTELPNAPEISKQTPSMVVPGVEMFINTVDDEVMGDGEAWALVKATLRETTGEAIINMEIDWETEVGTIIGQSRTNTNGHTVDSLKIENAVSSDINVGIIAKYGNNIYAIDILTFVKPETSNRLIMGFEPDTTGHGIIPCNIDTAPAVREVGISAQFVNSDGHGKGGKLIKFSVVPNNFATICPTDTTSTDTTVTALKGLANVMMVYPPQNGGEIVRVWAKAQDGTRGSIDVILPKDEEDDSGEG
jgi:hypothetical protein